MKLDMKKKLMVSFFLILSIILSYFLFDFKIIPGKVGIEFSSLNFSSDSENHAVKNVKYFVDMKNKSNSAVKFHLVIKTKDLDWYPYLDSIPKAYYSETFTLEPREGELKIIETSYNSDVLESTSGFLSDDDLEIQVIYVEE